MKRLLPLLLAAAAIAAAASPASAAPVHDRAAEALGQRLFPILTAVAGAPDTVARLNADPALKAARARRNSRMQACDSAPPCRAQAALWLDDERTALRNATAQYVKPLLKKRGLVPEDGIAAGVQRELSGLNSILDVYALGMPPRYPVIDGPTAAFGTAEQRRRLQIALWTSDTDHATSADALDSSIDLALALLDAHDRTDAIGFEPLDSGENAPAIARARTIDWQRYAYTAIIVPGIGREYTDTTLSAGGKYHLRLAAARFAEGAAPFIIVSGGRAHPRATPHAEAVEMRRALIGRYGIPADAIVIEPYARHTTTNLRNATRRLIALGAPLTREARIVCKPDQSRNIEKPSFAERNQRELGYQPGTVTRRLSPTELAFRPSPVSARIDPLDPLDP
ncbi:ElyC/SanA/YdcF family protein [Sphingomonas panaciterrae]|uniref:ElyC/SanA/YdcF family protein n=1 Tax=Sphingomonas panaciterrae TaxID=1462999 RepID=UPI002FEF5F26